MTPRRIVTNLGRVRIVTPDDRYPLVGQTVVGVIEGTEKVIAATVRSRDDTSGTYVYRLAPMPDLPQCGGHG